MDNLEQIKEIMRYRKYLSSITHQDIDLEVAAFIWIRKYAQSWRTIHDSKSLENH